MCSLPTWSNYIDLLLLSLPVARNPNLCSSEILIVFFKNTEPRSQLMKYCKIDQRKDQLHSDVPSDQILASLLYLYLYLYIFVCLYFAYYYISMCFCNLTLLSNVFFTKSDVKPVASLLYPLPEITLISSSTSAVVVVWTFVQYKLL